MHPAMRGFPLLRIRGIPVEAHWSLVFSTVYLAAGLASSRYLGGYPQLPDTAITAMSLASALLLPVCVLLHELGHALQARRERMEVDRITLWLLGGVAWLRGPSRSPAADFRVTIAGPLVSAVLAVLFAAGAWIGREGGMPDGVVGVLAFLAWLNAVMVVFNLLPAFPLDGGRLLHAALERRRGAAAAALWTQRVAVAVAGLMLAFGAVGPFIGVLEAPYVNEARTVETAWTSAPFLFWGLLLLRGAYAVRPGALGGGRLRALEVGDVVGPGGVIASPDTTVAEFMRKLSGRQGWGTTPFPVLEDGRMVGIISPSLALQVPDDRRQEATAEEVMVRKEEAVILDPRTPIEEAYERLSSGSGKGVVVEGDRVTGVVLLSDLADVMLEIQDGRRGSFVATRPRTPQVEW